MSRPSSNSEQQRNAVWVAAALFLFACVLAMNPLPFVSPIKPPQAVPQWATDTTPVRQPNMKPVCTVAVFEYRCSDCHSIIPAPKSDLFRTVIQHAEIDLQHGINTSCLNCHHPSNRDAFVDDRGGEIPWNEPQLLCAKCHGPVYRDWQHGSHGRTNGYWNESLGTRTRRKCIECHDPHSPTFAHIHPAPGPMSLRTEPHEKVEHSESKNPLRLNYSASPLEHGDLSTEGH